MSSQYLAIPRCRSPASIAASDTTYYSVIDVESNETRITGAAAHTHKLPEPTQRMRRQDSGYESASRRDSKSRRHRSSSASTLSSSQRRRSLATRRHSPTSGPISYLPRGTIEQQIYADEQAEPYATYVASLEKIPSESRTAAIELDVSSSPNAWVQSSDYFATHCESPSYPGPPQTIHYWTSDRTRRLEYAAIDAASRGVKGWVMRHMVPDCFIPRDQRRMRFDDDSGSVVRYRLDLDGEDDGGKDEQDASGNRTSWLVRDRRHQRNMLERK